MVFWLKVLLNKCPVKILDKEDFKESNKMLLDASFALQKNLDEKWKWRSSSVLLKSDSSLLRSSAFIQCIFNSFVLSKPLQKKKLWNIYITIDDFLGVCPSNRKLLLGFLRYQAEIFCVDSYWPKEGFKLFCSKFRAKIFLNSFLFL